MPLTPEKFVLLAEDDENDVFFFERAYRRSGCKAPLHVVRDGEDAVEYLSGSGRYADRQSHPLPNLLVLDLNMPRRNGLEVLRWIRSQPAFGRLIVVVFTSSSAQTDLTTAYELGANSYLLKPAEPEKSATLVAQLLGYWVGSNQIPLPPRGEPRRVYA